jgi:glycosyltransferase involved in cell wall biosynthesis
MTPKISVVIPAYNEEKLIGRCLKSLQEQSYPKDHYEVILVDNNSKDKTSEIGREYGVNVLLYKEKQGTSASRKYGIAQAKGKIIAITDSDTFVANDWLAKIDKRFEDQRIVCVGGQARSDTKNLLVGAVFTFYNVFWSLNNVLGKPLVWGFNMAFRKKAYEEVGGFDEKLLSSEDWDLAFRLMKRFGNKSIRYVSDLKAYTAPRKQNHANFLLKYTIDGWRNYIDFVILGKKKATPIFTVR